MLGSAVLKEFSGHEGKLIATVRNIADATTIPDVEVVKFDASLDDLQVAFSKLGHVDYVINCIGVIKPYINDNDAIQRANAIAINSVFPYRLEKWASKSGAKVMQIATDCVFSGSKGGYLESDKHDALDVYGKSKSLGEVPGQSMMHLRVSIIGPEVNRSSSLLEWVRRQPKNAEIKGFTDHLWNGITSMHFARIAKGIIEKDLFEPGVSHVLPVDTVTKFALVSAMVKHLGRSDIQVIATATGDQIDRTLKTESPEMNQKLWQGAGYSSPLSVDDMVSEMIAWDSGQ